jgi:hypothetical protein
MARIVFTTDGLDESPLILNEDYWLPPSYLLSRRVWRTGVGKYAYTVVPHELKREEYDRIWVVV